MDIYESTSQQEVHHVTQHQIRILYAPITRPNQIGFIGSEKAAVLEKRFATQG